MIKKISTLKKKIINSKKIDKRSKIFIKKLFDKYPERFNSKTTEISCCIETKKANLSLKEFIWKNENRYSICVSMEKLSTLIKDSNIVSIDITSVNF